jgi:hypothetical protein
MKNWLLYLKSIVWKDLFKPRYGLIVEVITLPALIPINGKATPYIGPVSPVICRLPVIRPLAQSYNAFVNENSSLTTLFITGSKKTISRIGNVGSTLPHNMQRAKEVFNSRFKDHEWIGQPIGRFTRAGL